jgi:rubrerythrin
MTGNFICENCNFKFKSNNAENCPWCGRRDRVEKEKSAEDLINESVNIE